MKLKLIYPDWGHFPLLYRRYIPVMGLAIVAALTPPEVEISFTDGRLDPVDTEEECDLVAISIMTSQADNAYEIARAFRARGIPVVLGGVHTSLMPEEALKHADTVVVGEAEGTWPGLIEDFKQGRMQRLYKCQDAPEEIPIPRWDIFPEGQYIPMDSLQVSRGCPVNCDMCSVPQAFGKNFRMLDTQRILKELEQIKSLVFVVNDNLHLSKRRAAGFLKGMAELNKKWLGLAPLSFARDNEFLASLRDSNCWAMYIDLSPWVSAGLNDVVDGVQVKLSGDYIKRVRGHGMKVIASFVFGFDHDEKDIFQKTVAFAKQHEIEECEFHILTPYPRSRLFDRLSAEDRLIHRDFSKYSTSSVVFKPRNMTEEQLHEGYLWAWREFYSDGRCHDTDDGLVVKSFSSFPLNHEDLLNYKDHRWMDAIMDKDEKRRLLGNV